MKTKSMKIASLLLTMVVLVATFCLFTTMASAEEQSATLSFANKAQRTSYSTTLQVWEQNGIKVTNNKGSSTSNVGDYANPARFYANSEFIVEHAGMTKIEFTCSKNISNLQTDANAVSGATASTSGSKVTVTFETPVDSFTIPKLTKQIQLSTLTVYYVESTGGEPEVPACTHTNQSQPEDDTKGNHIVKCLDCGETISTNAHTPGAATDAGDGKHTTTCTVCGANVKTEAHTYTNFTDNEDGTHTPSCSVCNANGEAVEHTNTNATNNGDGTHKVVCADCDAVVKAAENHTDKKNCTACGWTAPGQEFTLTLSFATTATRVSWDKNQQTWEQNGIKLVNKKGSGNDIIDSSNPVRFYKNSTITITYPGMTKIVFQCSGGSDYINTLDGNATVNGTTVTVTFDKPVDTYTVTLSKGQIRVSSLTVSGKTPCDHTESAPVYESLNNHNHKVTCADCGEIVTAEEAHTFGNCESVDNKNHKVTCADCGAVVEEAHTIEGLGCNKCDFVLPFEFSGWSLTLYDNLSLNFTVNAEFFANGYSNPTATFVIGERTVVVSEYTEKDGKYVFTLSDIAPYEMTVTIRATLSATKNGETVTSNTEKTIKEYCLQILNDPTKDAKVKTLVVDLLNYGAASQTYAKKYTDALANADLTDTQKEFGTQDDPNLSTVANPAYVKVDNAKVTWAGAQLLLVDTVEMNFVFRADSTEGLVVKVVTTSNTYTITEFGAYGEGAYVASFSAFNAAQMSEIVDVTVYEGGTAVSNTYRYSIESYAFAKQNDEDADLASLVNAMMKYGNSAKAYAEYLKGANA